MGRKDEGEWKQTCTEATLCVFLSSDGNDLLKKTLVFSEALPLRGHGQRFKYFVSREPC